LLEAHCQEYGAQGYLVSVLCSCLVLVLVLVVLVLVVLALLMLGVAAAVVGKCRGCKCRD
jgi:hypothetical protein